MIQHKLFEDCIMYVYVYVRHNIKILWSIYLVYGCTVTLHREPNQVIFSDESFDTFHHWPWAAAADSSDVGSRCSDCIETDWSVNASCRIDQTLAQDWISVWVWLLLRRLFVLHWACFNSLSYSALTPTVFFIAFHHYCLQTKSSLWCMVSVVCNITYIVTNIVFDWHFAVCVGKSLILLLRACK